MANSSKATDTATEPREMPGYSTQFDYVLEWLKESSEARRAQNAYVERAIEAYKGIPSRNRYKGTINNYVNTLNKHDSVKAAQVKAYCSDIPDKGSMVVHNAVETLVSMAMGGVGQYEFGPYDPDMQKDPETMDRLACAAKSFYIQNHVDSIVPQYVRNSVLAGGSYLHLKQKNGKKVVTILETSQMWTDPKRFKTNVSRFIGHSQRESFQAVKARTTKIKGGGYVLKTLNNAEVYVNQISQELNNLLQNDATSAFLHDELKRDLDIFYAPIVTRIKAGDKDQDNPAKMYDGDEIECSYIYDTMNGMYFEIINRRYVIVAKKNPLTRDIQCEYLDENGSTKTKTKTVMLDDPYIELPFLKTFWDTYPMTPLFYLLDDFDDLCAMESVLYHNLSIMAPLTFVGQSSDAEKVSRVASVAGEVVEGMPQTFGVLDKAHDITPVVTAVQRYEEKIKRTMKAVDPFEMQAMLGDRATAKEVVSASGQVSQGINQFLANIETAFATLGDKFIKLELIMNDENYTFAHNGKYAEMSREEMAGDYEINAKLVTSIKLEQEANARKAVELIQFLQGNEAIDMKSFLGTMVPIVLGTLVRREQIEEMIKPQYQPMPDEIIAAIKRRAEEHANKPEHEKINLDGYSPEELDQMAAALQSGQPLTASAADMDAAGGTGEIPPEEMPAQIAPVAVPAPADATTGMQVGPPQASVAANIPGGVMPPAPPSASGTPTSAGENANDQGGTGYGGLQ